VGGIERRDSHEEREVIEIHESIECQDGHEEREAIEIPEDKDGRENRVYVPSVNMQMQYVAGVGIIIDESSLLVYCNGSCVRNRSSRMRAAIGIYFGLNHPHNRGETIRDPLVNTN